MLWNSTHIGMHAMDVAAAVVDVVTFLLAPGWTELETGPKGYIIDIVLLFADY